MHTVNVSLVQGTMINFNHSNFDFLFTFGLLALTGHKLSVKTLDGRTLQIPINDIIVRIFTLKKSVPHSVKLISLNLTRSH